RGRPTVGVADRVVHRRRGDPLPRREPGRLVGTQAPRRPRSTVRRGVPCIQGPGALAVRGEERAHVVQVGVVPLGAVEVLPGQAQSQRPAERGTAVGVHHRAGDLRVVSPRPDVEVVRADAGPYVVDDTHLRVYVDRDAGVVLGAVHGDPVAG